MGTALTVTYDQARPKKFARHLGLKSGSIAFANYLTNGCALDFSTYFRTVQQVVFSDFSAGYAMEYDYTNLKVKVYTAVSDEHIHGAGNALFTANSAKAALGNGVATFTGDNHIHGLAGNGKLVITGNVAAVTAGIQYANSLLEMNAAGGNAALAGNSNIALQTGNVALTGNSNAFTVTGGLSGNVNTASSTNGMAELTNSTNMTAILTAVKFVVYGAM